MCVFLFKQNHQTKTIPNVTQYEFNTLINYEKPFFITVAMNSFLMSAPAYF